MEQNPNDGSGIDRQDERCMEHRDMRPYPDDEEDDAAADVALYLALQQQEFEADLTQEELMCILYSQQTQRLDEESKPAAVKKEVKHTQVESSEPANYNDYPTTTSILKPNDNAKTHESSPEKGYLGVCGDVKLSKPMSMTDSAKKSSSRKEDMKEHQEHIASSEFEDETRLMQSPVGVAWKLVERFLLLWHAKPTWNAHVSLIARDDMVAMAEKLVRLQQEWKLLSSSFPDRPWTVEVGFHWTLLENVESIREGGLLSKLERDEHGIDAQYNGSVYGDGVYTASNPFSFYGIYGDVCLMVARMQGTKGPRHSRDNVDTVVDESTRMSVLKSSAQCFPIFMFQQDDIRSDDTGFNGNKKVNECHVDVQRILDEFLNDGWETPVQSPYNLNDRSNRSNFCRAVPHRPIVPKPLPTRRAAADSNWSLTSFGASTNYSLARGVQKSALKIREHIYKAPSSIDTSDISYSPTAKMVHFQVGELKCQGYNPGTIIIKYIIEKGKQHRFHPNPGEYHNSLQRLAFLPNNQEGKCLLARLEKAFLRGQTFCVKPKTHKGLLNEVDWVIPHKTLFATGFDGFRWTEVAGRSENGFPDPIFFRTANNILDAFEVVNGSISSPDKETGLNLKVPPSSRGIESGRRLDRTLRELF